MCLKRFFVLFFSVVASADVKLRRGAKVGLVWMGLNKRLQFGQPVPAAVPPFYGYLFQDLLKFFLGCGRK